MEERATLANIDTTGCVLGGRKAIEVPAMEIITAGVRSGVVKRVNFSGYVNLRMEKFQSTLWSVARAIVQREMSFLWTTPAG